jgi:hypothetical protein
MVFYRNKNYPTRISQVGANNKHLQNFIKIGFRDWRERTSDFYTACAIYNFIFLWYCNFFKEFIIKTA